MFKVGFICDDKHFAPIMHFLSGKAMNLKWAPVINAKVDDSGKLVAKSNGDIVGMFIAHYNEAGLRGASMAAIREWLSRIGRAEGSAYYVAKTLVERKLARRVGKPGQYMYVLKKGVK